MTANPVDKLVVEWAYRCKKGYPDINNLEDKKVLEEIMQEWGLKEQEKEQETEENITVEDLIKLLKDKQSMLPAEFVRNLYVRVADKGKGLSKQLVDIFKDKEMEEATPVILNTVQQLGLEEKLLNYLTSDKKITISDLISNSGANLVDYLTKATTLPKQLVSDIVAIKGQKSTKGVGKSEYALALFLKDGKKASIGDIEVQGKTFEIKADYSRLGLHERTTGSLNSLYSDLEKLTQVVSNGTLEKYIEEITIQVTDEKILSKISDRLNKEFSNKFESVDISDNQAVRTALYSWYVEQFFATEKSDYILIYLQGEYRVYTPEAFREAILNRSIKFLSNFTKTNKFPQLAKFE